MRRAEIPAAEGLELDPALPPGEAWARACEAAGLDPDRLAVHVADYFRLKVADLGKAEPTAVKLVPARVARQYSIFPVKEDDRHLTVATSDPTNFAAEQALGFISGRKALFEVASPSAIQARIGATYGPDGAPIEAAAAEGGPGTPAPATVEPDRAAPDRREASAEPTPPPETAPVSGRPSGERELEPETEPILVVDDDPEDLLLVRTILQKQGYRVEEARDGDEALGLIGTGGGHALVILDLEMPRLDGREVLARLRADTATVGLPVVVLTGSPDPQDEYRLMMSGADDYLRKPVDPPRLIARVTAALRRARLK